MCQENTCELKESCKRFKAKSNKIHQSYFSENPRNLDNSCDYYWEIKDNTILTEDDEWKEFNKYMDEIIYKETSDAIL